MTDRPVVIAGASGFVGGRLVTALHAAGVPLRCGSRDPARARRTRPEVPWVHLDVQDARSVAAATRGAGAFVHLVHLMGNDEPQLVRREVATAERIATACHEAGLERIVYLGAPAPEGVASDHLIARARTGEVLRAGRVPCFELRASMIVGAGSESWLIVRDLACRLPIMVLPTWLRSRTQPVWIGDVVDALAEALTADLSMAGCWNLPGPETLSARHIIERTAAVVGTRPYMFPVPLLTPSLSSGWIRLFTRADMGIARKLVDGLTDDLLMHDRDFFREVPTLHRTPFDEAVAQALAEEEAPGRGGRLWERLAQRLARKA